MTDFQAPWIPPAFQMKKSSFQSKPELSLIVLFFLSCYRSSSCIRIRNPVADPNLDLKQCFTHIIFFIYFQLFRFFVGQFPCGSFQHSYLPALHVARQSSLLRSRYSTVPASHSLSWTVGYNIVLWWNFKWSYTANKSCIQQGDPHLVRYPTRLQ